MTRAHDLTSGPSRARLRLDPDARFALRADGHIDLPDLWDRSISQALADEAGDLWRTDEHDRPVHGPHLDALHAHLAGLTRSLTGRVLVPTITSYLFFDAPGTHAATQANEATGATEPLSATGEHELTLVASVIGATDYPCGGVRAFRGCRPDEVPARPAAIAVLHYGPPT